MRLKQKIMVFPYGSNPDPKNTTVAADRRIVKIQVYQHKKRLPSDKQ